MSGMREGAIRIAPRRRRRRPLWQIVVTFILAAVVVLALLLLVVKMFSGTAEPDAAATPNPSPCVTLMVSPAESLPTVSRVRVNVYNATQTPGLAGGTAEVLRARGFNVRDVGNAVGKRQVASVGEIRYGPKGKPSAELLAYYFPGIAIIPDGRSKRVVDVLLGEQFTTVLDDAKVAAAKASPTPSPSGPGCVTAPLTSSTAPAA
ncbi:MAG: LytR C-terminal domain-containing protein [Actinomycetota bacterium]|nr:LytR C-terminal domain-containing protein [Actinomycetota bacterium]